MPTRLQPLQVYYPNARARLIVRLEDYGDPATPAPAPKPTTLKKGITDKSTQALQVKQQGGAFVLVSPGDDPSRVGSPQQQMSSSDGYTQVIDGIPLLTADWKQNGIRTPDQLTVEFQFADLPIDPRVIRSCAIQFFLGTVSADDWQRGVNGELRSPSQTMSGVALPFNTIPDQYVDGNGRSRTNLRFEGWVDEFEDDFTKDGVPLVRFDCTDNTRLLIEQEAPPQLTVDPKKPLDEAVATYLANFPQFRGLAVQYLPAGLDRSRIPVLKKALAKTKFQPKLGPPPAGGGGGGKVMVWDYLTDVCGSVGHLIRMVGTRLVIQTPRTVFNGALPRRDDDPFTGRVLPDGTRIDERLFLYGDNIETMKFKRRYTRNAPVNIEVRSYDNRNKTTLVERFPQKGDRVKRLHPGDTADEKWKVITVRGVNDRAVLRSIAQGAYEQLGRKELGVTVVSRNLGTFGGGNLDPDALDFQPGDPLRVEILRAANENNSNTVVDLNDQVRSSASQFLRDLGFTGDFSDAYQRAVSSASFPTLFRAQTVGLRWDGERDGVTMTVEAVNYVEVRSDKQLPADEEITAADVSGAQGGPVQVSGEEAAV